jgi:hypothetical protein
LSTQALLRIFKKICGLENNGKRGSKPRIRTRPTRDEKFSKDGILT